MTNPVPEELQTYAARTIPTIGGIRQRGTVTGFVVTSIWPVGDKTIVMYLGEPEHESFPRPWVTKDKAKKFDTDVEAYQAATGAEHYTKHPILVQREYGKCRDLGRAQ